MKNWREDITGMTSLYDVDPIQLLIFLRHQYLVGAYNSADFDDEAEAEETRMVGIIDGLQEAIEVAWNANCVAGSLEQVFAK